MKIRCNLLTNLVRCLLASATVLFAMVAQGAEGWIDLFDGESLDGWRAAENPDSFRVVDGTILCDGPRAHLFYVGADGKAAFSNFQLSLEIMSQPGANSGVFFHTTWQASDWPKAGFEVQVNNSQKKHGDYLELKKTGSLYGICNVYKAAAPDGEWFTMNIAVQGPRVVVHVDDVLLVDYVEPVRPLLAGAPEVNALSSGTFALQCHDPGSKVQFRNLRVRPLPAPASDEIMDRRKLDTTGARMLSLARQNFPLVDLHVHLKGELTLENALAISRAAGMGLGIAVNGGRDFPVRNDESALEFLAAMELQPVFIGLQAEGREWMGLFAPETRAKFDYIFSDSMTFTNAAGKRLRLWIPQEADIGPDAEAFMDELVSTTVAIIENEPIDIYVNPTFLPASIAADYDTLWTDARIAEVVDALVENGVALEINGRRRIPSERFLRHAKDAGVKFTFGTNNAGAEDFGEWAYELEMQDKLGLSWTDMWVPGYAPSRAQREINL